jgi:DNA-binding PadR family transcriptional regulator
MEMKRKIAKGGYDIVALLEINFGKHISPGTVYSTLYAIERKGLITGEADGSGTTYRLTKERT